MKENSMNNNGKLKRSVLNGGRPKVLGSITSGEIRAALMALAAAMALVLLSGCASVPVREDSDLWLYNANTGQWFR